MVSLPFPNPGLKAGVSDEGYAIPRTRGFMTGNVPRQHEAIIIMERCAKIASFWDSVGYQKTTR
jgi:hypothetical protein